MNRSAFAKNCSRAGASLALLLAATNEAHANPMDAFGLGSRGAAMAGAQSADARDFSANYYNPAALTRAERLELSIGYFRVDHFLSTNGNDSHVDTVRGLVGGIVAPGAIATIPFAFGVAVHLPDDRVSRVRALRQDEPRWELYDNRNQRLYLVANLAVKPFSWLSIGAGIAFMSSTRARLDISGSANIFKPENSALRHEVDADLTSVRTPQVGALVELTDRVRMSAVYRAPFQLSLELGAHLAGDISGLTTAYYDLTTRSVNNFLPQQVVLGGAWDFTRRITATFDATWINWSAYQSPVASLDVALNIPPPEGGWPAGITPPTVPPKTVILPLQLRDRIVPRFGVDVLIAERGPFALHGRAGYEFAKSPIPPQTGATNYIDRDRHAFSIGVGGVFASTGETIPGELRLDLHAQMHHLIEGTTRKSSPTDLAGDYTAGGNLYNLGATLTFAFGKKEKR